MKTPKFDKVYYYYYRPEDRGGVTVAFIVRPPVDEALGNPVEFSTAICSPKEAMFCKRTGRTIAEQRLTSVSKRGVPNSTVGTMFVQGEGEEFVDAVYEAVKTIAVDLWDEFVGEYTGPDERGAGYPCHY